MLPATIRLPFGRGMGPTGRTVWAVKGRREEWIPRPVKRAARCRVVAWCWSACGLPARPARRSLDAAEERVQAGGEPLVTVVCPDVLAEGGQRGEPVGWQ
jgi:hypothetical protein